MEMMPESFGTVREVQVFRNERKSAQNLPLDDNALL